MTIFFLLSVTFSYAFNYTRKPYKTNWVPFLQVGPTRRKLGVPSVRKHPDGSDFPTLPILQDPISNLLIGDSFDIALYLHNSSPSTPLFPPQTIALHRAFNAHVDNLFSFKGGALLAGYYQRFDPKTAADDKAEFVRRIPRLKRWEDLEVPVGSEARLKMLEDFKEALGSGLAIWLINRDKGPFMEGATPMFADFIVE
jgi:glutathione S-transferase